MIASNKINVFTFTEQSKHLNLMKKDNIVV